MKFAEAKAIGISLVERFAAMGMIQHPQPKRDLTASVMFHLKQPSTTEEIAQALRIRRDEASAVVCRLVRLKRAKVVYGGSPRRYVAA